MAHVYKIFPSIGISRVGNTTIDYKKKLSDQYDQFYIAPEESAGLPIDPVTNKPFSTTFGKGKPEYIFRNKDKGNLKKQAARFKIFVYDDTNPNDKGTEVTVGGNIKAIKWTVYLANKKASWFQFFQLTGSGQEGDEGYITNNLKNPGGKNPNLPYNPLRNINITDEEQRKQLIIDPGPRTITGPDQSAAFNYDPNISGQTFPPDSIKPFPIDSLGSIFTDSSSNLLVFGGDGNSGTTNLYPNNYSPYEYFTLQYANNDGWFDDVADGPVKATLITDDGEIEVDGAWVICGPPSYAPQIVNMVSLYDAMFDTFVQSQKFPDFGADMYDKKTGKYRKDYAVHTETQIAPLLDRPNLYRFVADMPALGVNNHAIVANEGNGVEAPSQFPFYILRPPWKKNEPGLMPKLAGDNPISNFTMSKYATITATQYHLFEQWHDGNVTTKTPPVLGPGEALDKATLDNCVGGAFCPGIEMTWICRNITIYKEPFRIMHSKKLLDKPGQLSLTNGDDGDYSNGLEPGDLSKYMAQPWQTDFNECSNQPIFPSGDNSPINPNQPSPPILWWWPAQRPWYVTPEDATSSRVLWDRGFIQDPNNATNGYPNLGDMQMVNCWKNMGFIFSPGSFPTFIEIGRQTKIIDAFTPPFKGWSMPPIYTYQTTKNAPSLAAFTVLGTSSIYCALKANDGSNTIYIASSPDGSSWSGYQIPNAATLDAPSLAVFKGKLYCAVRAADGSNTIYIGSSSDGCSWSVFQQIHGAISGAAPCLAVFNNNLYCAYYDPSNRNFIYLTSSPDGSSWSGYHIPFGATSNAPSLSVFKGKLYLAVQGYEGSSTIYIDSSSDGKNWPGFQTIPNATTSAGPCLAAFNDNLYCAVKSEDGSISILSSSDGMNWSDSSPNEKLNTIAAPSIAVFNTNLYCAFTDEDNKIQTVCTVAPQTNSLNSLVNESINRRKIGMEARP